MVLAIVGSLAWTQLRSVGSAGMRGPAVASQAAAIANGSGAVDASVGVAPQQAKNLQDQVRSDAVRALQQGAQRNESADR